MLLGMHYLKDNNSLLDMGTNSSNHKDSNILRYK